jgi:hypothetical protein
VNWGDDHTATHFLLSLIDEDDAAAVRRRIQVDEPRRLSEAEMAWHLHRAEAPRAVHLWLLERDDPTTNAFVYHHVIATDTIKRDIVRGIPYGTATGPLPVLCDRPHCTHGEPVVPTSPHGMIGGLRLARSMSGARSAVRAVSRADWAEVAAADQAEPLPGFARWALSTRIDCPPEVRAQFGKHAKFDHRLRQAGVLEPSEYVESRLPAQSVLTVLHVGTTLFPERTAQAAARLAPLVRDRLGANLEAWAVLSQLLPTFTGTTPELVSTCGAVAHV